MVRSNGILIKLPKVKLEFGKCAFRFASAKIYSELPKEIRAEKDYKLFRLALDEHLRQLTLRPCPHSTLVRFQMYAFS